MSNGKEEFISVVIPTYNRKDVLFKAVDNVLQQSYKNIEIVVVDDSEESCLDELNKKLDGQSGRTLQYVFNGRPVGANKARNQGIDNASGSFIAFLDDDDEWDRTKLEKQLQVMKRYSDCPLVTCGALDYRYGRKYEEYPLVVATQKDVLNAFSYSSTSAYFFRASVLRCYRFDESLVSGQEYELAIQVSKFHKVRSVPEILVTQNVSEGQISTNWQRKIKGIRGVYGKHKQSFLDASWINRFKVFGIVIMFYLANWIGEKRVFGVLQVFKKRHNRSMD